MITVLCPYCAAEVVALEEIDDARIDAYVCAECGREFSVAAQLAYERGQLYYQAAVEIEQAAPRRRVKEDTPVFTDMLRNYQLAYSGLRVAFQFALPPLYQEIALEILADIMQRFLQRDLVSPLESNYWTSRVTAWKTDAEYTALQHKLRAGEGNFLRRWRWRMRRNQLARVLPKLRVRIAELERGIAFTELPYPQR